MWHHAVWQIQTNIWSNLLSVSVFTVDNVLSYRWEQQPPFKCWYTSNKLMASQPCCKSALTPLQLLNCTQIHLHCINHQQMPSQHVGGEPSLNTQVPFHLLYLNSPQSLKHHIYCGAVLMYSYPHSMWDFRPPLWCQWDLHSKCW